MKKFITLGPGWNILKYLQNLLGLVASLSIILAMLPCLQKIGKFIAKINVQKVNIILKFRA